MVPWLRHHSNVNDYLKDFYGEENVKKYLYRDRGKSLWDLYFTAVGIRMQTYRDFQDLVFSGKTDRFYMISMLYFLPCTCRDLDKPDMSEEDVHALMMLADSSVDASIFAETVLLLHEYRFPEKYRSEMLERLMERNQSPEEFPPCAARRLCEERLADIYPECRNLIMERSSAALQTYLHLVDMKTKMMDLFIESCREDFQDGLSFFGADLLDSLIRITVSRKETDGSKEMREFLESLEDDPLRQVFPEELKEGDTKGIWKMILDYEPDSDTNSRMFENNVAYSGSREEEQLDHLEDLMMKSGKLEEVYALYPEEVISIYRYRRLKIGNKLLFRLLHAPVSAEQPFRIPRVRRIMISEEEVLLMFLNEIPSFEDEREYMPDEVLDEIVSFTLLPEMEIATGELVTLINYSRKYRLKEDELLRWTETYFKKTLGRKEKER